MNRQGPQPLSWIVGQTRITRIQEIEAPGISFVVPEVTAASVRHIPWLGPHFVNRVGEPLASVHALVIDTGRRRILVDTCVGNHKKRPIPGWNERTGPFLSDLEEAGFPASSIDTVVCTHLHVDHVGWNTRLEDGSWVPTFRNARYLITQPEWEHWSTQDDELTRTVLADSVRPIFDAGLADLVAVDDRLDDAVTLEATPGHTPGHVSVRIRSTGAEAVITGDLLHHPAQVAHPEWASSADVDPERARHTRRAFLERHADRDVLVLGTHFAGPTAGHVIREGDTFRFAVS